MSREEAIAQLVEVRRQSTRAMESGVNPFREEIKKAVRQGLTPEEFLSRCKISKPRKLNTK